MNKLTSFAAFAAIVLSGAMPENARADETPAMGTWPDETTSKSVWPDETTAKESSTPAVQTPAPARSVVPGGYAQPRQQPPRWPVPQQGYGYLPPRYPAGGQYRAFPAMPATVPAARVNPLSAELKKTQEQLAAKSSELDVAHSMLEQLRDKLQENFAAEKELSEKIALATSEQQALKARVTELSTTLEQQYQLIENQQAYNEKLTAEREQLQGELARRGEQLAALQSELQATTQALAQARSRSVASVEALSAARIQIGILREALTKLEGELERQEIRLQDIVQTRIE
ncbi:MAG: hypothetical protein WBN57_13965 [Gammaproteobacteria bacterium]